MSRRRKSQINPQGIVLSLSHGKQRRRHSHRPAFAAQIVIRPSLSSVVASTVVKSTWSRKTYLNVLSVSARCHQPGIVKLTRPNSALLTDAFSLLRCAYSAAKRER